MKSSGKVKIFLGILLGIVLVVLVAAFFVSDVIEKKLVAQLSKNYNVTVEDTGVNLFNTTAFINNIKLISKNREQDSIQVQAKQVSVNFSSLYNVLFADTLVVSEVEISHPELKIYKSKDSVPHNQEQKSIDKLLKIKLFKVENGSFSLFSSSDSLTTSSKNYQLVLDSIYLNNSTLQNKIPFKYRLVSAHISQFYQQASTLEGIYAKDIYIKPEAIEVKMFHMEPFYSKQEYIKHTKYQTDWMDITVDNLKIEEYEFDFLSEKPKFLSPKIVLDKANLTLYRDKSLPRDFKFKPLYSKMLRDANVAIAVDTVKVTESSIHYAEKLPSRAEAGELLFSNMDVLITNVNNIDTSKKTAIAINCNFLNEAPLHVDWMFDIHSPKDYFEIKGTLGTIGVAKLNNFLEPNMMVNVKGEMAKLMFNFYGTNTKARGKLTMTYDNLKVEILNRKGKGKKKSKILSAIANIFIDSKKEEIKEQIVEVERVKYKSFFNYFWLCVQDGVKKTLL